MTRTVLVVAAHPDDEALGCGGTIAKHVAAGDKVHVVFMADGVGARGGETDGATLVREAAMHAAAKILGTSSTLCLGFADNRMDSLALLDIVQPLENVLGRLNPEIIYTHHGGDLNVDHRLTHQAVMTACRPQPDLSVKEIFTFEVLSSTEWNAPECLPFLPNTFVDINEFIETKISAIDAYSLEMRAEPHARSASNVRQLAGYRGFSVGHYFSEAFVCIRSIR